MLHADALSVLDRVAHGFFTREGGASAGLYASLNTGFGSGDEVAAVAENRRRAETALGFGPNALTTVYQVHSARVAVVTEPWPHASAPQADALVSKTPGVLLGILTADCAPVLFANVEAGVVGAAHAGWKGAIGGVLAATVDAMSGLGAHPETTVASIGPCIQKPSYEVDEAFYTEFLGNSAENSRFFGSGTRAGHYQFDLAGYVASILEGLGLGHVSSMAVDTYADEHRFYSYRRATHQGEADYGRLLSAIGLTG